MLRSHVWIAVSATLMCGTLVRAQGPYGYPGPYPGYNPAPPTNADSGMNPNPRGIPGPVSPDAKFPGSRTDPNPGGVPAPHSPDARFPGNESGVRPMPMPYGPYPGMMPMRPGMMPYGTPMMSMPGNFPGMTQFPPTPMPVPNGQQPFPPMPSPVPNTPRGEPYLVPPEKSTPNRLPDLPPEIKLPPAPAPAQPPIDRPELNPNAIVMQPEIEGTSFTVPYSPAAPCEPYVLHEGRRSQAELKEEGIHVWMRAEYIHWYVRGDSAPPLVTTDSTAVTNPGSLANTTTTILNSNAIAQREFSGLRLYGGIRSLDDELMALELGGFWLVDRNNAVSFSSNTAGSPVLSRPIATPAEGIVVVAAPGTVSGNVLIGSSLGFHGAELNLAQSIYRVNGWAFDYLLGFRYAYLNDTLTVNQTSTALVGGAFSFNGAGGIPAGSSVSMLDSFNMTSRFYGGQVGARINWAHGAFDAEITGKLALGTTAHESVIDGSSTLTAANGTRTTIARGVLAQPTNIDRRGSDDFSVLPEVNANLGYRITRNIRIFGGYSYLYWSRIQRAADQIDRRVSQTQVPTSATFNPNAAATTPTFPATTTGFWAQGLNVGLELRY